MGASRPPCAERRCGQWVAYKNDEGQDESYCYEQVRDTDGGCAGPIGRIPRQRWWRVGRGRDNTERLWTTGGWVLRSVERMTDGTPADAVSTSVALCFVPDPNHEWTIDTESEAT